MPGIRTLAWTFTALTSLATTALGAGPDTRGDSVHQVARNRAALVVRWNGCGVLDAPSFALTARAIVATQVVGGSCAGPMQWRSVVYVVDGLAPGDYSLSYRPVDRATGVTYPSDDLFLRMNDTFGAAARIDSVQPQPAFAGEPLEARFCESDFVASHRVTVAGSTVIIDIEVLPIANDPPSCNFAIALGSLAAGRYTIVVVPKCCDLFEFDPQTYELTVLPARAVPGLDGGSLAALVAAFAIVGWRMLDFPLTQAASSWRRKPQATWPLAGRTARAARRPPL